MEEDTLAFVKQCRDLNVSVIVSVASISTAALKLAKRHGISQDEFHASNGWVNNFVKKYKLRSKLLQGERASAPKEVADVYKATLPEILSLYQPEDIYNADEVGLNWERTARRSYIFEGDDPAGTKLSKKRITVHITASMAGHLEPMVVINGCKCPRAFNQIQRDLTRLLPPCIMWRWNKSAWMDTAICLRWLKEFDEKMVKGGRKFVLFLDNFTAHEAAVEQADLENVRIE